MSRTLSGQSTARKSLRFGGDHRTVIGPKAAGVVCVPGRKHATGLKTELDLISSGPERDFQGEQFLKDGTPWVLDIDRNFDGPDDLVSFDPATNLLSFAYHLLGDGGDVFSIVDASFPTGRGCATINGNGGAFSGLFAGTCGGSDFIATTSTSVTLRNGAVSEPATLGLLALSLAGLLGFRGGARGKWTPKRQAA